MTRDRLHAAADKFEITDLSSNNMRGLDAELERSVFWDDAFCSDVIDEGGPDGLLNIARLVLPLTCPIIISLAR